MSHVDREQEIQDLLADNNHCGQTLLRLVARGNAIIAELLRLSRHIPSVFLPFDDPAMQGYIQSEFSFANRGEAMRFQPVVCDFRYMKAADTFDSRISENADLLDLDEEFRETFMPVLERFYLLFESVYVYMRDYVQFLQDLEGGVKYIQVTFESVLVNIDGKQLLTEALYLYGCMLLMMDLRIPGPVRERILVSFYRYRGTEPATSKNIIPVCNMFRSTGFTPMGTTTAADSSSKKKQSSSRRKKSKSRRADDSTSGSSNYPIDYFARFPLPQRAVSMIIGRLRSDDIYQQTAFYPLPEHRSTALATQANMLYVILYFRPNILVKEQAIMREIVDKHWPDNWVISYYMGFTVDLSSVWSPFDAARLAIGNTVQLHSIRELAQMHMANVKALTKQLQDFLTEGVLTEEYVLDHINTLLSCLRDCNVTIRWLILHRTAENMEVREIISQETNAEEVLLLLLNTSQLEFVLKEMFRDLLGRKQQKWDECKSLTRERMMELSEYFSGEKALQKMRDEQLQEWFKDMAGRVDEFDYHDSSLAGRKINQFISALEDVKGFHQIESSLQVKQFLNDSIDLLRKMIRYVNIKESILVAISTVSDISYAWAIIKDYVNSMQRWIKRDPSLIIKIRSTFLKLASMLELPLVRISQAQSKDIVSVSSYYSNELVHFVRKTLDIIPMSMFSILNVIIDLQTNHLRQVPTKFPRDQLRSYAQLEERHKLARATFEVSKYTEGILAMKKTLVGVIEVDPNQLLEDGIRKELVRQISTMLDTHLVFTSGRVQDFEERLKTLKGKLEGMLLSFEYIQDYVKIYGLKIWQEEFSRIINYNVEQECNRFLKRKILEWQSAYQSAVIPIPSFRPVDEHTNNFMGRLVRELLSQTDPRRTTYYDQLSGWFDQSGNEIIGITTFSLLKESVGVFGMTGIDTLLCYVNVKYMQTFVRHFKSDVMDKPMQAVIDSTKQILCPVSSLSPGLAKQYQQILGKMGKIWIFFLEIAIKLGRTQLIRKHIASELNLSCKLDANMLSSSLDVMNRAILKDIDSHEKNPTERPYPSRSNALLPELAKYLETAGMVNPLEKIYVTCSHASDIGMLMALFVIAHLPRFEYDATIDCIVRKKKDDWLDAVPFVVGVITILNHFHASETEMFIAFLGQYVRALIDGMLDQTSGRSKAVQDIPLDVTLVLRFMHIYTKWSGLQYDVVERHIHPFLFAKFFDNTTAGKISKRR